jgi:hypothetical protein
MTEIDPDPPNSADSRKRCRRDGCEQLLPAGKSGRRFCTFACRAVAFELADGQRICEALGPSPVAGEMWAALVLVADNLTAYQRLERQLFSFARSVGITTDQWHEIKHPGR